MDYRKMDEISMSACSMPRMPVGSPVIFIKNLSKDGGPVDSKLFTIYLCSQSLAVVQ